MGLKEPNPCLDAAFIDTLSVGIIGAGVWGAWLFTNPALAALLGSCVASLLAAWLEPMEPRP